jgi:hypothetical protein
MHLRCAQRAAPIVATLVGDETEPSAESDRSRSLSSYDVRLASNPRKRLHASKIQAAKRLTFREFASRFAWRNDFIVEL